MTSGIFFKLLRQSVRRQEVLGKELKTRRTEPTVWIPALNACAE